MDAANFCGIICAFRLQKIRTYKVAGDSQYLVIQVQMRKMMLLNGVIDKSMTNI